MISAASWTTVKREFARVQEAPAAERTRMLEALPDDVRQEVASLLDALSQAPPLLGADGVAEPGPGTVIGGYRIEAEIGRGGMGTVYRVRRVDGEVTRPLALKVAGSRISAPEAQRRFVREKQILAALDHPHIVRLLDGGVAGGQRYFVMELAEGTPITAYCRERRLPLADRVRLLRQVCQAIDYAHQRLVLHRDLKPANVVVLADGAVKVLDFGIAQIVEADTGTATTRTMLHPMSLGCASPEQVRGEPLGLASDVYALGTLVYEVLTGTNPQYRDGLSVDEVLRLVVDTDPPPPGRVAPEVPRDLDAVTLKALAKAPAERYQSVRELDDDLARWLDGRPVSAVPPRPWYVFTRFVRRNRALSATAAALVASVVAGGVLTTRQARIAERRFEDARQLIHTTIFDLQPKLEAIPGTVELRASLIQETSKYLEAVSKDAGDSVPLLKELSSAYLQLARLQGDIGTSSLGRQDLAAVRYEAARTLLERALALEPENPDLLKDAALLYGRLSTFQNGRGQGEAARASARLAVTYGERHLAARPGQFDAREVLAVATFSEALNTPPEQWDLRRTRMTRALELYRGLSTDDPAKESVRRNVGIVSRNLASLYTDLGRGSEAVDHVRLAVEVAEGVLATRPGDTALILDAATDNMVAGIVYQQARRHDEAWRVLDRAATLLDGVAAKDAANVRVTLLTGEVRRYQARVRLAEGRVDDAVALAARAVDRFAQLGKAGPLLPVVQWRYAEALFAAADAAAAAGRGADACASYRRAHDVFTEVDRTLPLADIVKQDFETVKAQLAGCEVR